MEKNEKVLKPEESLQIINDMISSAKSKLSDKSFNFLVWGWTIALISLSHFIIEYFELYKNPAIVWLLIFPGMIITSIYNYRQGKSTKVFSHIDRVHMFTWIGFIISYFIVLFFMKKLNYQITPLIFILTAFATFVSGFILKFKPLIYGAIIFWIGAVLCFLIPSEFVQLLGFIILVFGFIIPGYMLKSYSKKNA
ncbi:MAG: hypothetical protein PF485_15450 [Bacteroidales bacterium]|jgi:hypothetical protein|nr:hypothetical protein [Bacteroidales bacterium]